MLTSDYSFYKGLCCVTWGYFKIKKIIRKYDNDSKYIFLQGATGDIYYQLLFIDEFKKQKNIKKLVIITEKRICTELQILFTNSSIPIEFVNPFDGRCIKFANLIWGTSLFNLYIPFFWEKNLGFHYNRCQVRMLPQFNFMDTYIYCSFDITRPKDFRKPCFEEVNYINSFFREKLGIVPNKTVLLSPEANSVSQLPIWFWNVIIKELHNKGYYVLVNSNCYNYYRAPNFFPSYITSGPVLEQAGYFLGIRSGFCDIIATVKCKKIILYPKQLTNIDISNHRSEIEFSGFRKMGIVSEEDRSLVEISTPLLRNITDKVTTLNGTEDYFASLEMLYKQILKNF